MQRAAIRILTEGQERQVMREAVGTECEMAVLLALWFGLRRSELVALRWKDIDFERMTVTVSIDKWYRELAMTNGQVKLLQWIMKQRRASANDYVILSSAGYRLTRNRISMEVGSLCRAAKVEHVGLKELRHTAIVRQMRQGMPMTEVQRWAGYAEYNTAFLIYAEVKAR